MPGPYDQSHNERPRNVFLAHLARPFKRACDAAISRADSIMQAMKSPAFLDQYPSNAVPYAFSKLYEFELVAPRRDPNANGYLLLANTVDLGENLLPRNGNIRVGPDGDFYWTKTNAFGYMSLTWTQDPSDAALNSVQVFGGNSVGDIFDSVVDQNGGAEAVDYFGINQRAIESGSGFFGLPSISWDLQMYDAKRGKALHENRLSPEVLVAQRYDNKEVSFPTRFRVNTEIEPRVRILESNCGMPLITDAAFNDQISKLYLSLTFIGYKVLNV